jgi:CDP-diacylglycerol--serine O-phosphatidyltransferase
VDEVTANEPQGLKKATVFLPNLFTVMNMALGFYAIISAFNQQWTQAAAGVFVGHIMDIIDGRLARFIGGSSKFGGEFDSFADLVSFGVAPAVMVYQLALKDYGKLGFLLAFLFLLCGALRLARFNLKSTEGGAPSPSFVGLPIPGAGGCVAMLVLLCGFYQSGHQGRMGNMLYDLVPLFRKAIPLIVFSLSLLMISKVQYATFKKTHFFRPQSLRTFMITVFVFFMIYAYPQNTIFILYSSYILWGLIQTGWRAYRLAHPKSQEQMHP